MDNHPTHEHPPTPQALLSCSDAAVQRPREFQRSGSWPPGRHNDISRLGGWKGKSSSSSPHSTWSVPTIDPPPSSSPRYPLTTTPPSLLLPFPFMLLPVGTCYASVRPRLWCNKPPSVGCCAVPGAEGFDPPSFFPTPSPLLLARSPSLTHSLFPLPAFSRRDWIVIVDAP